MTDESKTKEKVAVLMSFKEMQEKFNTAVACDIKEIKDDLLKRPSWTVTALITALFTVCGSLIVFIVIS